MRRGQSTVEYLLTVSVISIAVVAVMYGLMRTISTRKRALPPAISASPPTVRGS
jgi:Flp pilus assembly pilin Flp